MPKVEHPPTPRGHRCPPASVLVISLVLAVVGPYGLVTTALAGRWPVTLTILFALALALSCLAQMVTLARTVEAGQ